MLRQERFTIGGNVASFRLIAEVENCCSVKPRCSKLCVNAVWTEYRSILNRGGRSGEQKFCRRCRSHTASVRLGSTRRGPRSDSSRETIHHARLPRSRATSPLLRAVPLRPASTPLHPP